jgi:pimeloyl-ACP methyl ester carboxylesterase
VVSQPITQFARAGDVNIAYQVVGDGPVDLVWAYGLASNVDVFWEDPRLAAFFRRLAEFSRLIIYDRRGCGLSDRGGLLTTPTLEERADDILAVLGAVGSERASIFGVSEGAGVAALFASTHPDRTASIVLYGALARIKGIDHPLGWHDERGAFAFAEAMARGWGTLESAEVAVPLWARSMTGDSQFTAWLARYMRQSVSRNEILPLVMNNFLYDLVDVLPAVRVPTLVLHRRDDPLVPVSYARAIASMIPDARLVELEGVDHLPFAGDAEAVAAEIEEHLVGANRGGRRSRQLLTLVVMDVAAPARDRVSGESPWSEVMAEFECDVRAHLARFGGTEARRLGGGFLATFDGPARAIRATLGIVDAAERRGLRARSGVHSGECELLDGDVTGVALHVADRLAELADPGEILASGTVQDLVAGSGVRFGEGRDVELPGLTGRRSVFTVLRYGVSPDTARRLATEQANVFRLDGEYWTVGYRGRVVTLRDSKGLRDISRLLAEPGRELHVLELASPGGQPSTTSEAVAADSDLGSGAIADPVLDEEARRQYKLRISELEHEIDEAQERHDDAAAASACAELDALVEGLTSAYGLGGRVRRTPDNVERARKAVTRRIRDALDRVDRVHPPLGRHLRTSIHTGVFCRYAPERDLVWSNT